MKKSLLGLILLFVLLTTYFPKTKIFPKFDLNIKNIFIENNSIISNKEILDNLEFLYQENIYFLDIKKIEQILLNQEFIESFKIKKIYPKTIKLILNEKKIVAILYKKKEKYYISDKGKIVNFKKIKRYQDLPRVFGGEKYFFYFYQELKNNDFPIAQIKTFYFFESGRWDLEMNDGKIVKLPIKNYLFSLKNFINSNKDSSFGSFKIFDYRIEDQLILK